MLLNQIGFLGYLYNDVIKSLALYLSNLPMGRVNKEIYTVITIDTEQDVNKDYLNMGTYRNIQSGITRLSELFHRVNCKATWMVTPDVMIQNKLKIHELAIQGHEIGSHIHVEYFTKDSIARIRHKGYLHLQPESQQVKMTEEIIDLTKKNIGIVPTTFRSGRYGINDNTLRILKNAGYLVDSSVTPCSNWDIDGGPNWSKLTTNQPYMREGIMEVPISIIKKWGFRYWLRPSTSNFSTMKNIIDVLTTEEKNPVVLNIMFHSMESFDPNPYVRSDVMLNRLERILVYLNNRGARCVTLNQLYHLFQGSQITTKKLS